MKIVTGREMREVERIAFERHGVSSHDLMEEAGRGVAELLVRKYGVGQKVLVVAGPGNNGGDGLVVARILKERGVSGSVFLVGKGGRIEGHLSEASLVVDALFGTGLTRPVTGEAREVVEAINLWRKDGRSDRSDRKVIAVDIPSGLSADTGEVLGVAVRADLTCTLGRPKVGLLIGQGPDFAGVVETVAIGIPETAYGILKGQGSVIDRDLVVSLLPPRPRGSHKGMNGHLLLVGGSPNRLGAILLAARAALRSGAGLATVALPDRAYGKIPRGLLEAMYEPLPRMSLSRVLKLLEGKEAAAVGPGLGVTPETRSLVAGLIRKTSRPLVLDADALNVLAGRAALLKRSARPARELILTPHPGEFARLTGLTTKKIQSDRVGVAREFARRHQVTLVLKGDRTVVAAPTGDYFINTTGNPGMATAGMGDLLTGMIGSLLVQCLASETATRSCSQTPATVAACAATVAGVWIHGRAGDRVAERLGRRGLLASDLIEEIPLTLREFAT